jgi:deoxyribodipyrimidine photolyase-related protein
MPTTPKQFVYLTYDQLHLDFLKQWSQEPASTTQIIFIEDPNYFKKRPYHKQKLLYLLANGRSFVSELETLGYKVISLEGETNQLLTDIHNHHPDTPIFCFEAAERETRVLLNPLLQSNVLTQLPHPGWLSTTADFNNALGDKKQWRMDSFYRYMRQKTGLLMENDKPIGGKYSFDSENREKWTGIPFAPVKLSFEMTALTQEVIDLIKRDYASHPGQLTPNSVASTREEALQVLDDFIVNILPNFGPYEDAMSQYNGVLFHSLLSPLINLHRLMPQEVLNRVVEADVPFASKEGFVRQLLGWREFMRHVFEQTDGFTTIQTNVLDAHNPLPEVYWGKTNSGLNCLDTVTKQVEKTGYSHHITRLMVLGNIATLLDVDPNALNNWFWEMYIDAYDWVVAPNVLGMATFSLGDLFVTKPYIAGSAYIDKMSDYCKHCVFHPKKTCPITQLYWAFLERHQDKLSNNHRLAIPLAGLKKRSPELKIQDQETYKTWTNKFLRYSTLG